MSLEAVGKFIGPFEIESITNVEGEVVEVAFVGGRKHLYTKKTLDLIVTDEASELTTVQEKKFNPLVADIMGLLSEYNIDIGEIQMLFKVIGGAIDEKFNHARSILWFGPGKEYVAGFDAENYVSIVMADKIIKDVTVTKDTE